MFRLSRKAEYALRAIFHLAVRDTACTTQEISRAQDIPQPFLKKIIHSLVVGGLITSTQGQKGGLALNFPPEKITAKDVIEKVEGPIFLNDCLLCEGTCPRDSVCPLHEMWRDSQKRMIEVLESNNFKDLGRRHLELVAASKKKGGKKAGTIPASILGLAPESE